MVRGYRLSILIPTRFRLLRIRYPHSEFNILDVGAGNHSASLTKRWFPLCRYHGLDRTNIFLEDKNDAISTDAYFVLDLTKLSFDEIPDNYYDVLMLSHVIEHLRNGDQVIARLLPKLRKNGVVYIEFPSPRSVHLPSMRGTLNFYDDETHVRLYSTDEVSAVLVQNGCKILKAGKRRDRTRILLLPFWMIHAKIRHGYIPGSVFWDLLGFADYVFAEKSKDNR
jgi:hypothetical protein